MIFIVLSVREGQISSSYDRLYADQTGGLTIPREWKWFVVGQGLIIMGLLLFMKMSPKYANVCQKIRFVLMFDIESLSQA